MIHQLRTANGVVHYDQFCPYINFITVIIVGFEKNFTTVEEGVGSFELCVKLFTSVEFLPMMFEFSLELVTAANTAGRDSPVVGD